ERHRTLKSAVDGLYPSVKAQAIEAKKRGDAVALEAARSRIARWKWQGASESLDEALAKTGTVAAPAVARPAPEAAPVPAGMELPPLRGHKGGVNSAAFSPD